MSIEYKKASRPAGRTMLLVHSGTDRYTGSSAFLDEVAAGARVGSRSARR